MNDDAAVCVEGRVSTIKTVYDEIDRFIGYFAIAMSSIKSKELYDEKRVAPFPHPTLLLGRMMLSKDCRGKRIGSKIIDYIVMLAQKLNKFAACRFIAVDSKLHVVGFYKKKGFIEVGYDKKKRKKERMVPMLFDLKP